MSKRGDRNCGLCACDRCLRAMAIGKRRRATAAATGRRRSLAVGTAAGTGISAGITVILAVIMAAAIRDIPFAFARPFSRPSRFAGRHGRILARSATPRSVREIPPRDEFAVALRRVVRNGDLLSNPAARAQIAAGCGVAGWHSGAAASGWWQHGNGGYGWVGPLFWPFAYHDIYDYAIWGDRIGFWDYGYPDIYAGIFPPYGYDDLDGLSGAAAVWPQAPRARSAGADVRQRQPRHRRPAGRSDRSSRSSRPRRNSPRSTNSAMHRSTAAQNIRAACPSQVVC